MSETIKVNGKEIDLDAATELTCFGHTAKGEWFIWRDENEFVDIPKSHFEILCRNIAKQLTDKP